MITLISTLIAQGLLVGISEPTVPRQEIASVMDLQARVSKDTS